MVQIITGGIQAFELLKRPNVKYIEQQVIPALSIQWTTMPSKTNQAKYEGYIIKQIREAQSMVKLEE